MITTLVGAIASTFGVMVDQFNKNTTLSIITSLVLYNLFLMLIFLMVIKSIVTKHTKDKKENKERCKKTFFDIKKSMQKEQLKNEKSIIEMRQTANELINTSNANHIKQMQELQTNHVKQIQELQDFTNTSINSLTEILARTLENIAEGKINSSKNDFIDNIYDTSTSDVFIRPGLAKIKELKPNKETKRNEFDIS
jgi:leucyl aminopeptidase